MGIADVRIKIYTVSGRLIQEIESIAQPGFNKIEWMGLDVQGDRLANGVYLYKIIVDDGEQKVETIEKLTVLR
jgi:flagellar hook assembly protein FlgD